MFRFDFTSTPIAVIVASALFVGCGDAEVSKVDVEQGSMKQLSASVGQASPPITCPGNLKAKVGTKLVCSMPVEGKTYDVNVTVTEVEGSDVKYKVAVSDKPRE